MVFVVVQDGWSSCKEVTVEDIASEEQYDPDTVYGTANRLAFTADQIRKNLHVHLYLTYKQET